MKIPTNMHFRIFLAACVLFTTTECDPSFQDCPGGSVSVEVGETHVLTCVGYSGTAAWTYQLGVSATTPIGVCTSSGCTPNSNLVTLFNLTFLSGTSSELEVKSEYTSTPRSVTIECAGVSCLVNITEPTTTPPPTTTPEPTTSPKPPIPPVGIVFIVIGCVVVVGVIIGVGIWSKKKQKLCFKPKGNDRVNATPLNDNAPTEKPEHTNDTTTDGHDAVHDGRPRVLPEPNRRQGATATPNETPGAVDNASPSPRTRPLPQPRVTEHNMTTSLQPSPLPPLRTQAATSLTSVERNSFAESKKPLPSISPRDSP